MSINRSADRENLYLSDGYYEVLQGALDFNDMLHKDDQALLNRNAEIHRDLKYVREDGTLSAFKSMLPKYIYMLAECYAALANKLNEVMEIMKEGEIENDDTGNDK